MKNNDFFFEQYVEGRVEDAEAEGEARGRAEGEAHGEARGRAEEKKTGVNKLKTLLFGSKSLRVVSAPGDRALRRAG